MDQEHTFLTYACCGWSCELSVCLLAEVGLADSLILPHVRRAAGSDDSAGVQHDDMI